MKFEWLGNMGSTTTAFGLFFKHPVTGVEYLAGAACFGSTAGSRVAESVAGKENARRVSTLVRGACVHWSHPHSASYLINAACRLMARDYGKNIFVAYSDENAGEVGTVYQAANWDYCGRTGASMQFRTPGGQVRDIRHVSGMRRDRTGWKPGGPMKYKTSWAETKERLLASGCVFFKGKSKHRYVHVAGDKRLVRKLRKAIRWPKMPYPKRRAIDASLGSEP